jgi:hypothetical protein
MKKKSIISLLICCMTMGMVNTSCQDMLTPDSERHAYEVAQDTLYSYWGIQKSLQNIAERYVILNECRGDLVEGSSYVSDTIAAIINFGKNGYEDKYKDGACAYLKVSDFYHTINSCNAYIAKCDTARMISTGQQKRYMLQECAQVHAIRAWVYMQLIYAYGKVPFYKDPLLTTDDINKFITDPQHPMADAKTLADLLGPDLEEIYAKLDPEDMFPQYNNYGNVDAGKSSYVCHSMRTMFPLDVVIGDLYLMQGDETACKKAASYYYKFLNSKFCGPLETTNYISIGDRVANIDDPQFGFYGGVPYNEKSHSLTNGRYRNEAITCIPSNKGRLDGMVFTDINRLFGFEATLSASGSGDESSSSVSLNYRDNGYRRELLPSRGYEALCDSQKYECYIGSGSSLTDAFQELAVLPEVGDARRVWIYRTSSSAQRGAVVLTPHSEQYTLPMGDNTMYGKMISKQNPNNSFSTVYPLVYRKSTIWLRYAEAINRAGFPSYAFAILKNGLVSNHNMWFPTNVEEEDYTSTAFSYLTGARGLDYGVKDSVFVYVEEVNDSTSVVWGLPNYDPDVTEYITSFEDLKTYVEAKYQAQADAINDTITGDPVEPKTLDLASVGFFAVKFNNYPSESCQKALWYLDRREVKKAATTEFMNFNNRPYLRGYVGSLNLLYKRNIYDNRGYSISEDYNLPNTSSTSDFLTIGVHQRGCGILKPDDPERWSSYDYVKLVTKKIKENHGITVTKEQIYDGSYDEWVKEAVEDLIIDEDALELAFEGCRFSDLARVAIRRNDPSFLASRVAKRKGTMDMGMYNILLDSKNWYLPFPTE